MLRAHRHVGMALKRAPDSMVHVSARPNDAKTRVCSSPPSNYQKKVNNQIGKAVAALDPALVSPKLVDQVNASLKNICDALVAEKIPLDPKVIETALEHIPGIMLKLIQDSKYVTWTFVFVLP